MPSTRIHSSPLACVRDFLMNQGNCESARRRAHILLVLSASTNCHKHKYIIFRLRFVVVCYSTFTARQMPEDKINVTVIACGCALLHSALTHVLSLLLVAMMWYIGRFAVMMCYSTLTSGHSSASRRNHGVLIVAVMCSGCCLLFVHGCDVFLQRLHDRRYKHAMVLYDFEMLVCV